MVFRLRSLDHQEVVQQLLPASLVSSLPVLGINSLEHFAGCPLLCQSVTVRAQLADSLACDNPPRCSPRQSLGRAGNPGATSQDATLADQEIALGVVLHRFHDELGQGAVIQNVAIGFLHAAGGFFLDSIVAVFTLDQRSHQGIPGSKSQDRGQFIRVDTTLIPPNGIATRAG